MALKILAIKLRALGDTVLMTAPLKELIQAFPHSEIHALVKSEWAELLDGIAEVHKIWHYHPPSSTLAGRTWAASSLAWKLRKEKYDLVVNFHASPSSAFLALATGAKTRSIHFHGHQHRNRFSTVEIPGKGTLKPIIERDMDALRALSVHVPAGRTPKINLQPAERRKGCAFLEDFHIPAPILGLNIGASRPSKCWPVDRFASLAIEWCLKTQGSVFVFAGPQEEPLIQGFRKTLDDLLGESMESPDERTAVRQRIVATHQIPLRTLAAVLTQFAVLAGNDSGPKHMAVAVGTPTVTLFGPEHPFEWHPYAQDRHPYFFVDGLSCRRDGDPGMPPWCGIHKCVIEEHKCMRLIGVDTVLKECERVAGLTSQIRLTQITEA